MGRYKRSNSGKAKPVCFSLWDEHINMLTDIEKKLKKSRSEALQYLIEEMHKNLNEEKV